MKKYLDLIKYGEEAHVLPPHHRQPSMFLLGVADLAIGTPSVPIAVVASATLSRMRASTGHFKFLLSLRI